MAAFTDNGRVTSSKTKVPRDTWVETARRVLIEEGIAGVKVDRLANRLGVTRGGFYHNFGDREILLQALLDHWEATCHFLPEQPMANSAAGAAAWMEELAQRRLIDEDGYDHRFDMAVREWGRSDQRARWAVERADRSRLAALHRFFRVLGHSDADAQFRSRIFYYHQIGYYALGVQESVAERRRNAGEYLRALCGDLYTRIEDRAPSPTRQRR